MVGCVTLLSTGVHANPEEDLGRLIARQFERQYGLCRSPVLNRWVTRIGEEIATQSPRRNLTYRFGLVNSGEVNAWSLPGGYVYCTTGLLGQVNSDDDLAGILAHELAHLQNRDFQRVLKRQGLLAILVLLAQSNGQEDLGTGLQWYQLFDGLRQSRRHEAAADNVGVALCTRSGYDPAGLIHFLDQIAQGQHTWSYWETLLSTHPHPARRKEWVANEVLRSLTPERRIALAQRLASRARYQRALLHLQQALSLDPTRVDGHVEAARIYLAQGRPASAAEHARQALELAPHEAEAASLYLQSTGEVLPSPAYWSPSASLRYKMTALQGQLAAQEPNRQRLRGRIAEELRRLHGNARFAQALGIAQGVTTDEADFLQLALLVQAAFVLQEIANLASQINQMRWLEYDLPSAFVEEASRLLRSEAHFGRGAEYDRAGERLARSEELARDEHLEALESLVHTAAELRRVGQQVAPIFLELVASGRGRPLGPMLASRGALMEAQVLMAHGDLREVRPSTSAALRKLCEIRGGVYSASLARMGAGAGTHQALTYAEVLALCYENNPEKVLEIWNREGDLGSAAEALATSPITSPGPREVKDGGRENALWGESAYSAYVLLRLSSRRCAEERVERSEGSRE
ncbi:MAG: M48 family metalloprotease [candidate division WS1 bacterium]|nr:M48 family metalloprotease [candidate division WS1 bacterium]